MSADLEIPRADYIDQACEFWTNLTDFSRNNTPLASKVKFLIDKGCTLKEVAEGLRKFNPQDPNLERLLQGNPSPDINHNRILNSTGVQQSTLPYNPQPPYPPHAGHFSSFPPVAQKQSSWDWGAAASLGVLASAATYLGTRLFSNQEMFYAKEKMTHEQHALERAYEKKLAEKDAEISKIKKEVIEQVQLERERESQEVQEVVRLLKQQSDDVRKSLSALEETLALVKASQEGRGGVATNVSTPVLVEKPKRSPKVYEEVTLGTGVQNILAQNNDELAWMLEGANDEDTTLGDNATGSDKEIQVMPEVVVNRLVEGIMSDPNEKSRKKAVEYLKLRLQQLINQPKNQKRREIHRNKMFTRFEKVPDCIRLLKTLGFEEDEHGSLLELKKETDPQKDEDQLALLKYACDRLSNLPIQPKVSKETPGYQNKTPLSAVEDGKKEQVLSKIGSVLKEKKNLQPVATADPIPSLPAKPSNLEEVMQYVKLGKTPEDVEVIDDSPPDPNAPFSKSEITLPAKPYATTEAANSDPSNIWGNNAASGLESGVSQSVNPLPTPPGVMFLRVKHGAEADAATSQLPVSDKTTLSQLKAILAAQNQCASTAFDIESSGVVLRGDGKSMSELCVKNHDEISLKWVDIPEVH